MPVRYLMIVSKPFLIKNAVHRGKNCIPSFLNTNIYALIKYIADSKFRCRLQTMSKHAFIEVSAADIVLLFPYQTGLQNN